MTSLWTAPRFAVALAAVVAAPGPAWGEGTSNVRVESGADFDSNATREETGGPSDGLVRMVGELRGAAPWGSGGRVAGGWHGGGKLYFAERGEDVLNQRADASLQQALGRTVSMRWDGGVRDRTSRAPVQSMDHTRLSTGPGLEVRPAFLRISARGLYDRVLFKPNHAYDADGYGGVFSLGLLLDGPGLSVQGSGTLTRRTFEGPRLDVHGHEPSGIPIAEVAEGTHRQDVLKRAAVEAQHSGDFLLGGEVAWERNDSNSLGGGLTRISARVQGTVELPLALVLTAAATVQQLEYDDPLFLSETQLIEDEGRSSATLRVERPLSESWAVVAHGGAWFSPTAVSGEGGAYLRAITGVGLSYGLEP